MKQLAPVGPATAQPQRLLTINQTAAALAISRTGVYRLIRDGELVPVRVGRRLRVRPEHLQAFLREKEVQP
jgi:excisionase family DNA binding protein